MSDRPETMQEAAQRIRERLTNDANRARRLRELGDRSGYDGFYDAADEVDPAQSALSVDMTRTVDVLLGTGGPAYGVRWEVEWNERWHGYRPTGPGRVWFQDWFTSKSFVELDDDTSEYLFESFGVEYVSDK